MTFDRDVEALAVSQHGLITDAQAQGFGAKPEAIRHRRKTGRWIRHRRGVYRIVGAVVTQRLELLAAILATPGSVGSHHSAAALLGLPGFSMLPPHLTVERERRPRDGVILHESSSVPAQHLRTIDGIRCTSVARTIFDVCGSVRPGRAERALDNALARRMVTVSALQRVFDDLAEHGRGGTALCRALLEARGGRYVAPESELEARFIEFAREHGLPEPVRQVDLGDVDGWIGRVDFLFPSRRFVVEVDGRLAHSARLDLAGDRERDRRLTESGWTIRRLTWTDLTRNPLPVAAELRRKLAASAA